MQGDYIPQEVLKSRQKSYCICHKMGGKDSWKDRIFGSAGKLPGVSAGRLQWIVFSSCRRRWVKILHYTDTRRRQQKGSEPFPDGAGQY